MLPCSCAPRRACQLLFWQGTRWMGIDRVPEPHEGPILCPSTLYNDGQSFLIRAPGALPTTRTRNAQPCSRAMTEMTATPTSLVGTEPPEWIWRPAYHLDNLKLPPRSSRGACIQPPICCLEPPCMNVGIMFAPLQPLRSFSCAWSPSLYYSSRLFMESCTTWRCSTF